MTKPWLSVIGIGEDGLDGLSASARALLDAADIVAGGERHLAMMPKKTHDLLKWPTPLEDLFDDLAKHGAAGRQVAVLATGNPMLYGVGVKLSMRFTADEMTVIPGSSAFDMACARLVWPQAETACLTVHGRPVETVNGHLRPGARLVLLCRDGKSPREIAAELVKLGYGGSAMTALCRMGGPNEDRIDALAADWPEEPTDDFVSVGIHCVAVDGAKAYSRAPGLPDEAFRNDGQMTKREVRAITLAALQPKPGETLWDIGAGCGSIAIEWMRAAEHGAAVAIERSKGRASLIAENAAALGTPKLELVIGTAPEALTELGQPDAVFIGGGITADGVFDAAWLALPPGGRLVANVVTAEGEARVLALHQQHGGELRRLEISRAMPRGDFNMWRALAPVTQWSVTKPSQGI